MFDRLTLSYICTAAIFVPLLLILRFRFDLRPEGERIVRDAQKAGRVVEAVLVYKRQLLRDPGVPSGRPEGRNRWVIRYNYIVDGKLYHFDGLAERFPGLKVTLYYPEGHPEKAIPGNTGRAGWRIMIMYPLMAMTFAFFYWVVFA